jgi:serine/threonine protein kinase
MNVAILGLQATTCEYYSDSLPPPTKKGVVTYTGIGLMEPGSFSQIVLTRYSEQEHKEWVLKIPLPRESLGYELSLRTNTHEAKILKILNEQEKLEGREYLIQMIAFFKINRDPILLFTRYKSDLLQVILDTTNGLSSKQTLNITKQLLEISSFLKRHGVVHNDIKPDNIFVLEDNQIRLADFGFAFFMKDRASISKINGTREYMAPELVYRDKSAPIPFGPAGDMWSNACTIYAALSKCPPFWGNDLGKEFKCLFGTEGLREYDTFEEKMTRVAPKSLEENDSFSLVKDLLRQMLALNPEERLTPEAGLGIISRSESPRVIEITDLSDGKRPRGENEVFSSLKKVAIEADRT